MITHTFPVRNVSFFCRAVSCLRGLFAPRLAGRRAAARLPPAHLFRPLRAFPVRPWGISASPFIREGRCRIPLAQSASWSYAYQALPARNGLSFSTGEQPWISFSSSSASSRSPAPSPISRRRLPTSIIDAGERGASRAPCSGRACALPSSVTPEFFICGKTRFSPVF